MAQHFLAYSIADNVNPVQVNMVRGSLSIKCTTHSSSRTVYRNVMLIELEGKI